MRLLRNILVENVGLKISALAIATVLWAAYNSAPIVETGYNAPLLLVNVPPGLEVTGEVPSSVLLRLRGRLGRLRRVTAAELSVSADCRQARAGSQLIRLAPNMVSSPNGPEIVSITPPQIEVSLVSASAPSPARN